MLRTTLFACCLLLGFSTSLAAQEPRRKMEKAWYSPAELLTALAERDGIQWALPETLSGRALVGGEEATLEALLSAAAPQWKLSWIRAGSVIVVHRADNERLKALASRLEQGDATAAWELGWLRDGRAIPHLAAALVGKDIAVVLAAAQAIETLDTPVPLGCDERVEPLQTGRVSLAAAFPAVAEVRTQFDSPFPLLRAAAYRLLLSQRGEAGRAAQRRIANDASEPARRVRLQWLVTPAKLPRDARFISEIPPLPKDDAAVKAACERLIAELPSLEKQSGWEQMQWRVETMADWARRDSIAASDALLSIARTKIQHGWFPGFVQRHLAATASPAIIARLREIVTDADRAALVRGLEQTLWGDELLAILRPHLDEQTVCYVAARKAGRETLTDLIPLAERGDFAAIDALGVIGGPQTVPVLAKLLQSDQGAAGTVSFRSAKALGRVGTLAARDALLSASRADNRLRRQAATLFLGQVGGPEANARLQKILAEDKDRLVRAAAADALAQVGDPAALALVQAFRDGEAAPPQLVYRPRNARFDERFPVNQWVNLKIDIQAHAEFGEIGWNYDAANRLFFRYGGCSGYTNELTVFDLGTEKFQQRRPNEEMAGWGDRRPARGCSGGRCWDPHLKVAWIGPVIGGGDSDLAIAEYYNRGGNFRLGSYDLATDRFRAAAYADRVYGEPSQRYAYDWQRGLLIPVKFSPFKEEKPFWVLDARAANPYDAAAWLNKTSAGDYPREGSYATAAVDQNAGLMALHIPPRDGRKEETWTYDPAANLWKNVSPAVQPQGQAGAGFVYEPFQKVLLLQSGREVTQYGGPDDSITWSYDVKANTWTDLKPPGGPGNPWVGAMDFDPEHNVFVLFNYRDKQVWAYRYKNVSAGTEAK